MQTSFPYNSGSRQCRSSCVMSPAGAAPPLRHNRLPASQTLGRVQRRFAAAEQIGAVPLVNILSGLVPSVAAGSSGAGKCAAAYPEKPPDPAGAAKAPVFVILQPSEIGVPLFRGQLGHLVDRVGGGITRGQNQPPRFIVGCPESFVAGLPVHRIKRRCRIGIDCIRIAA